MARIRAVQLWTLILCVLASVDLSVQLKKGKSSVVANIEEMKDFKKLLRSKTNVLVLFVNSHKGSEVIMERVKQTAEGMKGQATVVSVDCSSDPKKVCKKLKIPTEKAFYIKHYKDGEFHKDYERGETVSAMTNFLRDPTGDLPWEEDPSASVIYHLSDGESLTRFLKRGSVSIKRALIMFYAPWCGYCRTLKPEFVQAAIELKGEAYLAAIDVAKPGNSKVRQLYNITGFPTILYYENGQLRFPYNGDNKKDAIVDFVRDPTSAANWKKKDSIDESWMLDNHLEILTNDNFDSVVTQAEHALVVFYVPWCGHCKRLKPELEKAAARIKTEQVNGVLAAVDAMKQTELSSRFAIKGYPTIKYFHNGEYMFDVSHARNEDEIVSFLKDPQEPPPPPMPEDSWAEQESAVRHLTAANFRTALRKTKHALVMFYVPWCGHCKNTKPEFEIAAETYADELIIAFAAVDCTEDADLCKTYNVKGYPTIKYFSYFNKIIQDYTGERKEAAFVSYINTRLMSQNKGHGTQNEKAQQNNTNAAGFGRNVTILTDADFEDTIASSRAVFVMFYAPWCNHCTDVKPVFSRLATALRAEMSPVRAVAINISGNPRTAEISGVQSLPTFKLFVAGREYAEYQGDRTMEDMYNFCTLRKYRKNEL